MERWGEETEERLRREWDWYANLRNRITDAVSWAWIYWWLNGFYTVSAPSPSWPLLSKTPTADMVRKKTQSSTKNSARLLHI